MGLSAADKENAGGEVEMGDLDSLKVNMEEVTDDAAAQQKKRNRLVKRTSRLFLSLYFFGLSGLFIAMPTLMVKLLGFKRAASFLALCLAIERGLNFFLAPMIGMISDQVGRKPVLVMSILASMLPLAALSWRPSPITFLLYYTLSGLNSVLFMVFTMMTDVVDFHGSRLAGAYGRLYVAICVGMVSGPVVSGFLARVNVLLPLRVSAAALAVCLLIICLIPETRDPRHAGRPIDWEGLNPVKRIWRSCRSQRFALLGVPYLFMFTAESVYIIFVLYLMRRYSWPREVVGGAISVLAISQAIVQGSIKFLVPHYISEMNAARLGLVSHITATLIMGSSPRGWMLCFAVIFLMGGGFKSPALLSIMTTAAPEKSRGTLQGSLQSLRALALFISGPMYNGLLSYALGERQHDKNSQQRWTLGLPFYVAAACDTIALILASFAFRRLKVIEAQEREREEAERRGRASTSPSDPVSADEAKAPTASAEAVLILD